MTASINGAQTTVIAGTAVAAFLLSAVLGTVLIPWLRRLKFGQMIRDVGPSWHKKKQGTPTMGGLIFIIGTVVSVIAAVAVCELTLNIKVVSMMPDEIPRRFGGLAMALCCAAVGFADDYVKVVKKRNLGLTSAQKMFAQLVIAAAYAILMYVTGGTLVEIPLYGTVDFGIWFIPFCVFTIAAMTNAVNFTDGVDGLCGTVSFTVAIFFIAAAGYGSYFIESFQAAALAGALTGFLLWNMHPARVFMGDTGSLFIGGMITALAFSIGKPFLLLPAGIVYFAEMMSVVMQVLYFKATKGKRLFKMSPIHHHFEMSGWSETKIVVVFTLITLFGCAAAGLLILYA